ncbi:Cu(I)-responsive transcriptional regulator [Rhodobium orientis]|uniref:Cu(I)-responsive transcriptional regulator n=1 Tax=Rhodobium orientis TaxID=34017 RepID=A0A327JPG3_9HYPH|nr:Cu(I)-responsive transcriptional regulator [Rhodobium orientis]MBB4301740.1 Cu(I)-responsive transcriptional regulator [Rhodobium orientis]MBK5950543.1 Cu(I)-responsive transcriptional regulator [Rhodobium orientis]RAI28187.1 Cu(I)-responsive transcriptional regulator [Rhodobium orientis]
MNIGQAARRSALPAKTIRYYEEIGLVAPGRRDNGYRDYDASDVHKLQFLKRARGLGFSIDDCRHLLSLYEDKHRASADVKALARARIEDIDARMAELQSLRTTLAKLVECCHGDDRPDCPILDDLAGHADHADG